MHLFWKVEGGAVRVGYAVGRESGVMIEAGSLNCKYSKVYLRAETDEKGYSSIRMSPLYYPTLLVISYPSHRSRY